MLLHSLLDGKIMNSVMSWTDIQTELMITSTICDQDSVRICSLDVEMNNTDESFFFTVGVLKRLTFILHKDVENVD
jgi:hypothetical protein